MQKIIFIIEKIQKYLKCPALDNAPEEEWPQSSISQWLYRISAAKLQSWALSVF